MKKTILAIALCAFAFGLGFNLNNIAHGDIKNAKIAIVDVNKLLANSKALKQANSQKDAQANETTKWFTTISKQIQNEKDKTKRAELIKKYEPQLTQKKKNIADQYTKKIQQIDKQLNEAISQKAKAMGYDLVLRSDMVLYGGNDITNSVVPLVK